MLCFWCKVLAFLLRVGIATPAVYPNNSNDDLQIMIEDLQVTQKNWFFLLIFNYGQELG